MRSFLDTEIKRQRERLAGRGEREKLLLGSAAFGDLLAHFEEATKEDVGLVLCHYKDHSRGVEFAYEGSQRKGS